MVWWLQARNALGSAMNTEQCQAFLKVMELGSFAKAAQELFVTSQSVSQQIARLEREIGAPLLVRSSTGVTPTDAGRIFGAWCRQTAASGTLMIEQCRALSKTRHVIRLGISRSHTLALYKHFTTAFLRDNPDMNFEFVDLGNAEPIDLLLEKVQAGVCDVIEWVNPQREGMGFLPLVRTKRCCLLSSQNPLSRNDIIRPEDLIEQKVYVYSGLWTRNLRSYLNGHCPQVSLIEVGAPDSPAMMRTYLTGNAVYLLPEQLRDLYENLVSVPLDVDLYTEYGLVYLLGNEEVLSKLLETARQSFKES